MPLAFRGTLSLPDPYSTGMEETPLRVWAWLPPDGGVMSLLDLEAPMVDGPGGLVPFGAIAYDPSPLPGLLLDWNPDDAPAGTVICPKVAPCDVADVRTITFTLSPPGGDRGRADFGGRNRRSGGRGVDGSHCHPPRCTWRYGVRSSCGRVVRNTRSIRPTYELA